MKLSELKTPDEMTFRTVACRMLSPKPIIGTEGRIRRTGDVRFELITNDQDVYPFVIENKVLNAEIISHFEQHQQNLVEVVSNIQYSAKKDIDLLYLHIVFFVTAMRIGQWYVTLDNKIKAAILKMRGFPKEEKEIENAIRKNFKLTNGTKNCFAITIGKYNPDDFAQVEETHAANEETAKENTDIPVPDIKNQAGETWIDTSESNSPLTFNKSIIIYGADFSMLVRVQGREGDEILRCIRIDRKNRKRPIMTLAIGELEFSDHKVMIEKQLREQLSSIHGYLDLWARYASAEGDFLLQRARTVGFFEVKNPTPVNDGSTNERIENRVRIYPKGLSPEGWEQLSQNEALLFTTEIPIYLQDEMSWNDYQEYLSGLRVSRNENDSLTPIQSNSEKGETLKITEVNQKEGYIVLKTNGGTKLPAGIASLSIAGNKRQIERREAARNMIDNAQSANPALGLIIEGQLPGLQSETGPHRQIDPVSPLVQDKIFKYPPTQTQIDAISLALNTPDIAIVQGPPGTGKTTVVTAIIERLNELADHSKDNRGSVLVTSFQHDAVRNVTGRLRINSLPTIKFGRQGDDDESAEQMLEDWRIEYTEKLKERNPGIRETEDQKELTKLRALYIAYPSSGNALRMLEFAKNVSFATAYITEIQALIDSLTQDEEIDNSQFIHKIRRLRTTKESFADDGSDVAYDLLHDLERKFASDHSGPIQHIMQVLYDAADCYEDIDEAMLKELKQVQYDLLRNCLPSPPYYREKPRSDILDLIDRIIRGTQHALDKKDEILYNLLNELEGNPERVKETISAYNFVFAATTQQSEGRDIRQAKNVNEKNAHPIYDTVVIDEAARVNPGDLLIPMTQARKRIIMVGDHRQLPHIYDEEIFESMQTEGVTVDKNIVKQSMFQYLMQKAKDLTALDHIPRSITLNAQYRMHPLLGEFVSKNFYDQYGEGFISPLPASNFEQKLWPSPVKWVDLPPSAGKTKKIGTSRNRDCEAEYIVDALQNYLNNPEGKDLTYGVITFYSGQRDLIRRKLEKKLGEKASRVRIGSVDAFQGMEFDVIFLSVVRCRSGKIEADWSLLEQEVTLADRSSDEFQTWSVERQRIGMKHYGFLISSNRLCVALSRQKRLLIVVGDAGAFTDGDWGRLAKLCVPAMQEMAALCRSEGVLIDGKT